MALTIEDHRIGNIKANLEIEKNIKIKKAYLEGLKRGNELKIGADPLPKDDPHAPVKPSKDQPGSSPWLPGKSPAPSRPSLAEYRKLMIAGDPSFTVGGSKGSSRNKK